jgi:hypothetical protein
VDRLKTQTGPSSVSAVLYSADMSNMTAAEADDPELACQLGCRGLGSTVKPGHFAVLECRFINRKLQTGVCHQPNCSSTPAALVEAILRPMYTFCVSEGWACPSWSAMARADNPASSSRVAVVLRKT